MSTTSVIGFSIELGTQTCDTHIPSIINFESPEGQGYATSDLFTPHPTIEGLWRLVGRLDDVIVHSTGEKTVPAPLEAIIGLARRFFSSTFLT